MPTLAIAGGNPVREQPFHHWPHWDAQEQAALQRVLKAGSWGGFPSPNTEARRFADDFARACGAPHGICCANGSVALELALKAAGIGSGDEVVVPAYTFVATASSVVHCGGKPVFADVLPETLCIDPKQVEAAITPATRAVIVVHLACNMADMDAMGELARRHDLTLIEDCAHAHGHRWKGRPAGSLGDLATFSFQTSKLLTAGEGGIVLARNRELAHRLHSLVNCGRKEPGLDDFPGHVLGHNYRLSEWQAAVLGVQLTRLDRQTARREEQMALLQDRLANLPGISFTRRDPRNDRRACYQLILRYDPTAFGNVHRDRFLAALQAEGIPAEGRFYVPIPDDELFPAGTLAGVGPAGTTDPDRHPFPVTAKAAYHQAIWLPHQLLLGTATDIEDIARSFEKLARHVEEIP